MSLFETTFDDVMSVMEKDLDNNYDVCFVVEQNTHQRQGSVGGGKSNLLLLILAKIAQEIGTTFWPPDDLVVKDDYRKFFRLLHRDRPYGMHGIDELFSFFNRQIWNSPLIKTTTHNFIHNRKDHKVWGGAIPTIWRAVPTFHMDRVNILFRAMHHDEIEVYQHTGFQEEDQNRWGGYLTTVEHVPFLGDEFPELWSVYEWMNAVHPRVHLAEYGCIEGLMSQGFEKARAVIKACERELLGIQDPSIEEKPRKAKKGSKPPDETARQTVARQVAPKETYPLLMGRAREEVV